MLKVIPVKSDLKTVVVTRAPASFSHGSFMADTQADAEVVVADQVDLLSLPHALVDLILSYLPFHDIAAAALTSSLLRDLQRSAAHARSSRLSLPHVPANPLGGEPPLSAYAFAEALANSRAAAPGTIAAAEMHSLLVSHHELQGSSRLLSWGVGLHLGHDLAWYAEQRQDSMGPCLVADAPSGTFDGGLGEDAFVVSACAGLSHSVALTACGEAYSWGYSGVGALGLGSIGQQPLPMRISALCSCVVVQASCSERHTLFLTDGGDVYVCGDGHGGRLGHGSSAHERSPRRLTAWQKPTPPHAIWSADGEGGGHPGTARAAETAAAEAASDAAHARALRDWASGASDVLMHGKWVDASCCELDPPPRISCVSAGEAHSHAIASPHGHLYSWGMLAGGRLGLRKQCLDGSPSRRGTVCRPMHADMRDRPGGGPRFTLVSAGDAHSLAVDERGALWSWGRNCEGQLGVGDEKGRSRPTRVSGLVGVRVRMAAAGTIHSAAVSVCGAVYTWGVDAGGRLGHSDGAATVLPRRVASLLGSRVVEVATAREHTLFRLDDGTVLACGKDGPGGRLGFPLERTDDGVSEGQLNAAFEPKAVGARAAYGGSETIVRAGRRLAGRRQAVPHTAAARSDASAGVVALKVAGAAEAAGSAGSQLATPDLKDREMAAAGQTPQDLVDHATDVQDRGLNLSGAGGESTVKGGDAGRAKDAAGEEPPLELVLRNVDISLSEAAVCAAGGFLSATRMARTGGGGGSCGTRPDAAGSRPRKLLPLMRVMCASPEHTAQLLADGLDLGGGTRAIAEVPVRPSMGAAARGKRSPPHVPSILQLPAVAGAALVPGRATSSEGKRPELDNATPAGEAADRVPQPVEGAAPAVVIVCRETSDYHRVAVAHTGRDDRVLEIGSDLGALCALAWPQCAGRLVGVDLAELSVARARQAHPHIRFVRLDALQVGSGQALRDLAPVADSSAADASTTFPAAPAMEPPVGHTHTACARETIAIESLPFTKVFIDINGNRPLPAVCQVLQIALEELRAPFVVCKSRELHASLLAREAVSQSGVQAAAAGALGA